MGPRLLPERREETLLGRSEPGLLRVHGHVRGHLLPPGPVDPLGGPHALDEALLHELARPRPHFGQGRRRVLEGAPPLLLEEVRVPDPVEIREEVLLPRDPWDPPQEELPDLPLGELDRADVFLRHDPPEDLPVELPEEGGPVLHEDEVRDPLEDAVVGEGGGQVREVGRADLDGPPLDPLEDLAGPAEVHDLVEDLVVRLLDDGEILDLVEPVEDPLGPQLLPADGHLPALVVPEDHEGPGRAVPEALLEQLRVPDGAPEELLEALARDEPDEPID